MCLIQSNEYNQEISYSKLCIKCNKVYSRKNGCGHSADFFFNGPFPLQIEIGDDPASTQIEIGDDPLPPNFEKGFADPQIEIGYADHPKSILSAYNPPI